MPQAIGTSLLVIAINSAMALLARIGSVRIDWTIALAFTVAAVVGVQIGSHLADRLDPKRSLRAFAAAFVPAGNVHRRTSDYGAHPGVKGRRTASAGLAMSSGGRPSLGGCYLPAFTAMSWCAFASASYSLASAS
jgi:hypothetical protein